MGSRRLLGSPKRHVCLFFHGALHITFMNSGYVQIEVCYKHRNSHISAMWVQVCNWRVCGVQEVCAISNAPTLSKKRSLPAAWSVSACFATNLRYEKWVRDIFFFVQSVRIRQPFLPPAPREIPKGSCIVYVVVHTSGMLTLVCFFGHVDEWALDDFSAHLNGMFVCSSTAHFTSPSWTAGMYKLKSVIHIVIVISQRCWRLFVFLCMYKWKLKSAATAGIILLPLPMHFCLENMHFCQRRAQVWEMVSWLHFFRFLCRG